MAKPTESELDTAFKEAYEALGLKYDEPDEVGKPTRKSFWFIKDLKKVAVFLHADVLLNDALALLTEAEEKEIRTFLETNRVMTGRDRFTVGSLEKAI